MDRTLHIVVGPRTPSHELTVRHRIDLYGVLKQAVEQQSTRPLEPESADPPPVLLGRDDNDRLIFGLSAADAFFLSTDVGFIHLHKAVEPIPAGPDHGTPQLVEPTPSCLVAAQAEHLV